MSRGDGEKEARRTFRNIRYPVRRIYYYVTDSAAAVSPPVGLAPITSGNMRFH